MTVQQLLQVKSLGMHKVVVPRPELAVTGAHTLEIHEPARWFEPGNMMLTTGLRLAPAGERAQIAQELASA
ncbi:PucR family transcriptional regulator ligand-binding domain-containing protein, partial [Escherichia coli]|uniref:PucR family transcriptional regulator ligand-binding domain-containing protein n=1 Tax=Escherichia coli TaxID=562 RepID=UPI001ED9CC9C